jgi:hypothetical protein
MKPVRTSLFARLHCGRCVLAVPLLTPKPLCIKALRPVLTPVSSVRTVFTSCRENGNAKRGVACARGVEILCAAKRRCTLSDVVSSTKNTAKSHVNGVKAFLPFVTSQYAKGFLV